MLGVQRLFSMFPPGFPGIGLVLLRLSVASSAFLITYGHRSELGPWILGGSSLLAVALFFGVLTPVVALAALGVQYAVHMGFGVGFQSTGYIVISTLNALALSMLGPGAYSFDAYRFGRRVIDLPPGNDRNSL